MPAPQPWLSQAAGFSPLPALFGGIQVNEPDHGRWARAVRAAGLDSVQVTLYARQQAWDSDELYWDREAPWVEAEIRAAKRAGLRVVLVMRVALEHGLTVNRHLWHGMIWPRDDRVDSWFGRYGDFVAWGAQIASRTGADLFAIGNELNSLTSTVQATEIPALYAYLLDSGRVAAVNRRLADCAVSVQRAGSGSDLRHLDGGTYVDLRQMLDGEAERRRSWTQTVLRDGIAGLNARRAEYLGHWRELLAHVRTIYPGPITYGANFDQFEEVAFWGDLDAVGVNAYFPLGEYGATPAASARLMRRRWALIADRLEAVAVDRPVVMLELGWTRKAGATVRPYSYERVEVLETAGSEALTCVHWASQAEAPFERVAAMRALEQVVTGGAFPSLRGFTLWKLTTDAAHRAIEPFAVVLPGADREGNAPADQADRELLATAGRIAQAVRARLPGWHNQ